MSPDHSKYSETPVPSSTPLQPTPETTPTDNEAPPISELPSDENGVQQLAEEEPLNGPVVESGATVAAVVVDSGASEEPNVVDDGQELTVSGTSVAESTASEEGGGTMVDDPQLEEDEGEREGEGGSEIATEEAVVEREHERTSSTDTVTEDDDGEENERNEGEEGDEGDKNDHQTEVRAEEDRSVETSLEPVSSGDSGGEESGEGVRREEEHLGESLTNGNGVAGLSGQQKEKSVFLRLSNRIRDLEENMSLFSSYLDQISTG